MTLNYLFPSTKVITAHSEYNEGHDRAGYDPDCTLSSKSLRSFLRTKFLPGIRASGRAIAKDTESVNTTIY